MEDKLRDELQSIMNDPMGAIENSPFLKSIMESNKRELEWQTEQIAKDKAWAESCAKQAREDRIIGRMNELLETLFGDTMFMMYEERVTETGLTIKSLAIEWIDEEFEGLIGA